MRVACYRYQRDTSRGSEVMTMDTLHDAKSDNYRSQYKWVLKGYNLSQIVLPVLCWTLSFVLRFTADCSRLQVTGCFIYYLFGY
jgi:hypothetical protein